MRSVTINEMQNTKFKQLSDDDDDSIWSKTGKQSPDIDMDSVCLILIWY